MLSASASDRSVGQPSVEIQLPDSDKNCEGVEMSPMQYRQEVKPLVIERASVKITINVPSAFHHTATVIKETLPQMDDVMGMDLSPNLIELLVVSGLLEFTLNTFNNNSHMLDGILGLLNVFFSYYNERFFSENDVHVVAKDIEQKELVKVFRVYYSCRTLLRKHGYSTPSTKSALFEAAKRGEIKLFASFGGQGNVEDYFQELIQNFNSYYPLVMPFVSGCAHTLAKHSTHEDAVKSHASRIDLMKWLDVPERGPNVETMLEPHLSLPLIALTQLTSYYSTMEILDLEPRAMRELFVGTTGHSQGIVSSVVISASETKEDFIKNTQKALGLLFWLGLRSERVFPATVLSHNIIRNSLSHSEGVPTPMLSIYGLRKHQGVSIAKEVNKYLPENEHVHLALENGPRSVIFSGPPKSLYALNVRLREYKNTNDADNSRIPFSERRLRFFSRFLPVAVPFHSVYLSQVINIIAKDVATHRLDFNVEDFAIPVYDTNTGENMKLDEQNSVAARLANLICVQQVQWLKATDFNKQAEALGNQAVTHFLDFGPGRQSGVGALTYKNTEGCGVQVIVCSSYLQKSTLIPSEFLDKVALYDTNASHITFAADWSKKFKPVLVRTRKYDHNPSDNDLTINGQTMTLHISTKFSRLIGKPPLMIAGMTPTTASPKLVIAATNAGFHIEFAGGGQYSGKVFRENLEKILDRVPQGMGVSVNLLYLNPKQWAVQFPLVISLRKSGVPIEGVCVAAGVPAQDVADSVVSSLLEAGIKHVSFKPSSTATINSVISIARRNPDMPIVIQWTGGRAGGHHSYEDFHQPLLETYASIRRFDNIILVVGSGFGDASETFPYITGSWSKKFGYPPMPVDGLLFGSRLMVASEALTSDAVKELIVKTPGIQNEIDWVKAYKNPIGGVVTIVSELNEPIHVLATRGAMFWKKLDELVFKHPRKSHLKEALANKDFIIAGLNKDFQRPWFGKRLSGSVCELREMTYLEVVTRYIDLTYVRSGTERKWVDRSLAHTALDFLFRIEERFSKTKHPSLLGSIEEFMENPVAASEKIFEAYPECQKQTLTQEDVFYFIVLLKEAGRKPPPFVPVIDEDFVTWFKKDSLWQSENLETVIDQDPQRVIVLQGPLAVRYSTKANVPVKDIMNEIYLGLISELNKSPEKEGHTKITNAVDYRYTSEKLILQPQLPASLPGATISKLNSTTYMFELSNNISDIPNMDRFFEFLVSPLEHGNWLEALMSTKEIVQGKFLVNNYVRGIFKPSPGQTLFVKTAEDDPHVPVYLAVYDRQLIKATLDPHQSASVTYNDGEIVVSLFYAVGESCFSLDFVFEYKPWVGSNLIYEKMEGREKRIKDFYIKIWGVNSDGGVTIEQIPFMNEISGCKKVNHQTYIARHVIDPQTSLDYAEIIGNRSSLYCQPITSGSEDIGANKSKRAVPMDMAIVVSWRSIVSSILPDWVGGDLLRLVHLSNSFRMLSGKPLKEAMLYVGDKLETRAFIRSVTLSEAGKTIEVQSIISREEINASGNTELIPLIKIITSFLCRGRFTYDNTFKLFDEKPMKIVMRKKSDIVILLDKQWIKWIAGKDSQKFVPIGQSAEYVKSLISVGSVLIFRLNTYEQYGNEKLLKVIRTSGTIEIQSPTGLETIGKVEYLAYNVYGNVVMGYLKKHGSPIEQAIPLTNGPYNIIPSGTLTSITIPSSSQPYSDVSGDRNPIHTSPYFASVAGLPGVIVHGMWTSAAVRKFVEIFAADNEVHRVRSYSVSFRSIVLQGDVLETRILHTGMINGRKLLRIETYNQNGDMVLEGSSEVEEALTAYSFSGQGSQQVGMGMYLYETSSVAREIWDKADDYMLSSYGISILEIVRKNPKTKTLYFGGKAGSTVRRNYISMTYEVVCPDGSYKTMPLFPGVTEDTLTYTFKHPEGLLYATQFTQPALTLMEYAQFEDMRANGLVQDSAIFAGHSLGEYAALASAGQVISVEALIHVVFYRGITMQVAVPRDSAGRSNYGMVSVNPSRVSGKFTEEHLKTVVKAIPLQSPGLIEIVNHNIERQQYVTSGCILNLELLRYTLDSLSTQPESSPIWATLKEEPRHPEIQKFIEKVRDEYIRSLGSSPANRRMLNRGIATVPLPGIDVPFHSSFLLQGVAPFRDILMAKIEERVWDVRSIVDKYIPNVTGKPFKITKEYCEYTYSMIKSSVLKEIIDTWDEAKLADPDHLQKIGHKLVIELLSYQFASSVRWIDTQDSMFGELGVVRFVEISPAPVLCNMADRTINYKYKVYDKSHNIVRTNLCVSRNAKEIYYQFSDSLSEIPKSEKAASGATSASETKPDRQQVQQTQQGQQVQQTQQVQQQAVPTVIEDQPIASIDVIAAVISAKMRKRLEQQEMTKSLRDISAGKSTLLNEIIGDLGQEYSDISIPESFSDVPLLEVAAQIDSSTQPSKDLGPVTSTIVGKLMSSKLPGLVGARRLTEYLREKYGLPPGYVNSVLLHTVLHEPQSRLSDEAAVFEWVDKVVASYGASKGITINKVAPMSGGPGSVASVTIDNEVFKKHKSELENLVGEQMNLFSKYLGVDLLEHYKELIAQKATYQELQNQLDMWLGEHGVEYGNGIAPKFSTMKVRSFDSFWNWVYQDVVTLYHGIMCGRINPLDKCVSEDIFRITNRSVPESRLLKLIEYLEKSIPQENKDMMSVFQKLFKECEKAQDQDPLFRCVSYVSKVPNTFVDCTGKICYREKSRSDINDISSYVAELEKGSSMNMPRTHAIGQIVTRLGNLVNGKDVKANGLMSNDKMGELNSIFMQLKGFTMHEGEGMPYAYLKSRDNYAPYDYVYDKDLTKMYFNVLKETATKGVSFKGRNALVTGCGRGSIGEEVVKALISGGASVIVTTSSFSKPVNDHYRLIYEKYGSKYSRLVVVPFNGGSFKDIRELVKFIYKPEEEGGLAWDLDFIIPFAAVPERSREIDNIDSTSELAHRIMLVNVFRLIGEISKKKEVNTRVTRPAAVVLPLSHNHGIFGGDGLYAESKISLETLFKKFYSESWNDRLTIIGAIIGWTRGTGLMSASNLVAQGIESLGAKTFTTQEMAFNIAGLLHSSIVKLSFEGPIVVDLNGGMDRIANVHAAVKKMRDSLYEESLLKNEVVGDERSDREIIHGEALSEKQKPREIIPRANMKFAFPKLPDYEHDHPLKGMLDLDKVTVVVGFGEVGSWGSQRTRWEMESTGQFSTEGLVELAWAMGLINFHNGPLPKRRFYSGWIDPATKEPVEDDEVKKYIPEIMAGVGMRYIEPETSSGYEPDNKVFLQEISVANDLPFIETTEENAKAFKKHHGDSVEIQKKGEQWLARLKKGAAIFVPKAVSSTRFIAGQVPKGWDPRRYGVTDDIVRQVDPSTIFTLVSTIEALISAGITDPYELYEHMHVSDVGNCTGGGMGGVSSMQKMFVWRKLEKPVQSDILQETFINTMAAWVNMLLLSSSGPVKIPVGACATALGSVDVGCDTINMGKAKMMFCGGFDDLGEEGSHEFGEMRATSNSLEEYKKGREPREMCRPASDTRAGFMEAHGAGVQILTTASVALKMGFPIYGIIVNSNTAMDKQGRSVPAPGQGLLTSSREVKDRSTPLMEFSYRCKQLKRERAFIKTWITNEYKDMNEKIAEMKSRNQTQEEIERYISDYSYFIQQEAKKKEKAAQSMWFNEFWRRDNLISPFRGALAVYGLTIDDIGVASFHGTGTLANDQNESSVLFQQMEHLGRSQGNILPGIFQKHLTGHPKGAAGAWMLNGVLQVLQSGIIPGNSNLDNVDGKLRQFEGILFNSRPIQTKGIKAAVVKSFGFGQAGAEVLVLHPNYVYKVLELNEFQEYAAKLEKRQEMSYKSYHKMMTGQGKAIEFKESAPYTKEDQSWVYLNPKARARFDPKQNSWNFNSRSVEEERVDCSIMNMLINTSGLLKDTDMKCAGIGMDIQLISDVSSANENFIKRNFTQKEIEYCTKAPCPQSSFAGRWAAKEAVIKAISDAKKTPWEGHAASPLEEIEIVREEGKAPIVKFHGEAEKRVKNMGVKDVKVSISHSGAYAVSIARAI